MTAETTTYRVACGEYDENGRRFSGGTVVVEAATREEAAEKGAAKYAGCRRFVGPGPNDWGTVGDVWDVRAESVRKSPRRAA